MRGGIQIKMYAINQESCDSTRVQRLKVLNEQTDSQ